MSDEYGKQARQCGCCEIMLVLLHGDITWETSVNTNSYIPRGSALVLCVSPLSSTERVCVFICAWIHRANLAQYEGW